MTSTASPDQMVLEMLARDSGETLRAVRDLYEQEYAALAEKASVTSFIPVLALRRVRSRLLPAVTFELH